MEKCENAREKSGKKQMNYGYSVGRCGKFLKKIPKFNIPAKTLQTSKRL